jgi:hypothetical protein
MVLILTEREDPHADVVETKLKRRGAEVYRFDYREFPQAAALSIKYTGRKKEIRLGCGDRQIDLSRCTSGWLRRPGKPIVDEVQQRLLHAYAEEECFQVLLDTWNTLDTAWLPGPIWAIRRADCKQLQLELAAALGFEIPPTLITSDPDEFLDFYRQHGGQLIDKTPSVVLAASQRTGMELMRFTQPVTTRDVGYARRLRYSPMLFQPRVPKRFELRITVVGEEVLAAEIHSQATHRTKLDWRHYDWGHTPYRPHALPAEVREQCLRLVAQLGLRYGAIDMIVTPDDRYVFLEINPNGQWLWVEQQAGLPISDAICEALIRPSRPSAPPWALPGCAQQERIP